MREAKDEILDEAHNAPYAMHPGSTRMYRDLREHFWWKGMKKDVAERYRSDPSHVIQVSDIQLRDDLSYEEIPVAILDTKEKVLRNKTVQLVKVLWRNHAVEEATWEPLDAMKEKYPGLFDD
ncbi:hypothetical protein K2173_021270 [Erythroxylum novogranatense]|uniref:Integrase zinc-binding domain-containing protein n=1 Tax=Erythroxylum novogranatense TaxID=1862640 RepID=A0AAV8TUZ0_9ROSI|nr:hypothetical protein K2173_021270 [Erythroxylum novogranatense]